MYHVHEVIQKAASDSPSAPPSPSKLLHKQRYSPASQRRTSLMLVVLPYCAGAVNGEAASFVDEPLDRGYLPTTINHVVPGFKTRACDEELV
ncbi:MAG: hypothetical protein LBJ41_05970 [Treponema sp.]|nr:hypothetical protein [Treponema sp.]